MSDNDSGFRILGTLIWMGTMYFLFFSGDDGDVDDEEKGFFDIFEEDKPAVDDYSYDTCKEELASKHYDNETIEQLCKLREINK